jgi:hypothetical protein
MRRVCRQFDFIQVKIVKQFVLLLTVGIANEWQKSETMVHSAKLRDLSLVDKLNGGPHCNGGKWIEDLLNPLVQLSDVLNGQTRVIDL